ncbi:N-acetylmuramoyl-L-alanine amidase [Saccharopolyspora sp. NFXS83]|uniref:N-acetylmuramoyl-L-alanine amidase n=1 Tax=Saccharopolyspora sp. NFXS83 TaxID=2993560 RepID=UPI00224A5471|nr:N-acetylmuramoyl-L-alanine amidase [Saccharopolyspora sp. NFXS83]MCX2731486.1 N-acetylmuramoyl-L-alanine amidase [Saccharopolyspora sp. NFXS83]
MITGRRRYPRSVAVTALAAGLLAATTQPAFGETQTPELPETVQQRAFESAAEEFGVPAPLLMAVSFQLTRWEGHRGEQSKAGGYGPMHLTDVDPEQLRAANPKLIRLADSPSLHTLDEAAELAGLDPEQVKGDLTRNIRAGAALLAERAERFGGGEPPTEIGAWYPAVAELSGSPKASGARSFADDVYDVLGQGRKRTTSTGQRLAFAKVTDVVPDRSLAGAHVGDADEQQAAPDGQASAAEPSSGQEQATSEAPTESQDEPRAECPDGSDCRYIPAAYAPTDPQDPSGGYGNYDTANRPEDVRIDSIVLHNTELSYQATISAFQNPATGSAAHYVVRSSDGQITQMVPTKDIPWQAGSWDRNVRSIGIEHEGWAAEGGTWYTEQMYSSSAELVRYLAEKYDIPLDREHILGHDEVTAESPAKAGLEHYDPGPFWDWAHYMNLLEAPLDDDTGGDRVVTIFPNFETNRPEVRSCPPDEECEVLPEQGANFLHLRTEPRDDAPLLTSPVVHPDGAPGSTRIEDWGNKAATGRQYAVAERSGDWLAIWFDGKKAWLRDPDGKNTAPAEDAELVRPVRDQIPTYGRAVPDAAEYPEGTEAPELEALPYKVPAGQVYVAGPDAKAQDYYVVYDELENPKNHTVVKGTDVYVSISYNHRWVYVRKSDLQSVS